MNKLFIILLAVCLVSVNSALVKREAETPAPNYVEDFQKKMQEFSTNFNNQLKTALDPEQVKKVFNEGIDNISKAINDLSKIGGQGAQKQ